MTRSGGDFQPRPLKRLFTANQCRTSFLDAGGLRDIEVEAVTKMLACGTRIPGVKEFMERFSWHVADKGFRMVRYYGFLSPVKRRLLEEVVYAITETVRKTAIQIRWRGMYQRLLKVDPLKCILCGSQMRFTGLKRGYRLAELVLMHERLARQQVCG